MSWKKDSEDQRLRRKSFAESQLRDLERIKPQYPFFSAAC
jgi:hypothetical protein